jgi:hypothetical protein
MIVLSEQTVAVYHYSAELAIFNLANSEFKNKHAVVEHLVIVTENDFYGKWTLPLYFPFDMDLAMVN